jgi:hypothetical protein
MQQLLNALIATHQGRCTVIQMVFAKLHVIQTKIAQTILLNTAIRQSHLQIICADPTAQNKFSVISKLINFVISSVTLETVSVSGDVLTMDKHLTMGEKYVQICSNALHKMGSVNLYPVIHRTKMTFRVNAMSRIFANQIL